MANAWCWRDGDLEGFQTVARQRSAMVRRKKASAVEAAPFIFSTRRRRVDSLAPQAHNHVDASDFVTLRRHGDFADCNIGRRNIHQLVPIFQIIVVVFRIVGTRSLPQKAFLQRRVDRLWPNKIMARATRGCVGRIPTSRNLSFISLAILGLRSRAKSSLLEADTRSRLAGNDDFILCPSCF